MGFKSRRSSGAITPQKLTQKAEEKKAEGNKKFSGRKTDDRTKDIGTQQVKLPSDSGVSTSGGGRSIKEYSAKALKKRHDQLEKVKAKHVKQPEKGKVDIAVGEKLDFNRKLDQAFDSITQQLQMLDDQYKAETEGKGSKDVKQAQKKVEMATKAVVDNFKAQVGKFEAEFKANLPSEKDGEVRDRVRTDIEQKLSKLEDQKTKAMKDPESAESPGEKELIQRHNEEVTKAYDGAKELIKIAGSEFFEESSALGGEKLKREVGRFEAKTKHVVEGFEGQVAKLLAVHKEAKADHLEALKALKQDAATLERFEKGIEEKRVVLRKIKDEAMMDPDASVDSSERALIEDHNAKLEKAYQSAKKLLKEANSQFFADNSGVKGEDLKQAVKGFDEKTKYVLEGFEGQVKRLQTANREELEAIKKGAKAFDAIQADKVLKREELDKARSDALLDPDSTENPREKALINAHNKKVEEAYVSAKRILREAGVQFFDEGKGELSGKALEDAVKSFEGKTKHVVDGFKGQIKLWNVSYKEASAIIKEDAQVAKKGINRGARINSDTEKKHARLQSIAENAKKNPEKTQDPGLKKLMNAFNAELDQATVDAQKVLEGVESQFYDDNRGVTGKDLEGALESFEKKTKLVVEGFEARVKRLGETYDKSKREYKATQIQERKASQQTEGGGAFTRIRDGVKAAGSSLLSKVGIGSEVKVDVSSDFEGLVKLGEKVGVARESKGTPPLSERIRLAFDFIGGFSKVAFKGRAARQEWLGQFLVEQMNKNLGSKEQLNVRRDGKKITELLSSKLSNFNNVEDRIAVRKFLTEVTGADEKGSDFMMRVLGQQTFSESINQLVPKETKFGEKIRFMKHGAGLFLSGRSQ